MPILRHQRRACVKPYVRRPGYGGIFAKERIFECILHHENFRLKDGMCAESHVARRLIFMKPDLRLEPLSVRVDQLTVEIGVPQI